MKIDNTIQWADYKKEGGLLVVSLLLSIVILGYLWVDYQDSKLEMQKISQQHEQLVNDIDQAVKDKTLLKEMGESFKKLQAQGFYGEEDRLALTEALKNTADTLKLPTFKYAVSPQVEINNVGSGFSSQLALMETVVSVDAELPHEFDFVRLGRNLSAFAEGAYLVKSCQLSREKTIQMSEITKNVGLNCSFAFYTSKMGAETVADEDDEVIDLGGDE